MIAGKWRAGHAITVTRDFTYAIRERRPGQSRRYVVVFKDVIDWDTNTVARCQIGGKVSVLMFRYVTFVAIRLFLALSEIVVV